MKTTLSTWFWALDKAQQKLGEDCDFKELIQQADKYVEFRNSPLGNVLCGGPVDDSAPGIKFKENIYIHADQEEPSED